MNARHVYRMVNQLCDAINGIRYQAILTNIEHISDKCSDIAVYVLERDHHEIFGKEHSYVHELHISNNESYLNQYQMDHDKYFAALEAIPVTATVIVDSEDEAAEGETTDASGAAGAAGTAEAKGAPGNPDVQGDKVAAANKMAAGVKAVLGAKVVLGAKKPAKEKSVKEEPAEENPSKEKSVKEEPAEENPVKEKSEKSKSK